MEHILLLVGVPPCMHGTHVLHSTQLVRYLILPLAGRVVQVGVAPVIAGPLLGLLVHPVQLIGAALHVVPQAQQVALPSARTSLTTGTYTNRRTWITPGRDILM